MVNVNRKRIEVVAAVIEDGGRIFATQRGYGEFKDMWEFPGGKMSGISPDDALLSVQCGVGDSGTQGA